MPILKMMPHNIETLVISNAYEDENGDYHKGVEEWKLAEKCDAVLAGPADTIALPDGGVQKYSYTIYLPKNSREFHFGERVRINFFYNGILQGTREFSVKGFQRYQLQCKMWV